MTDTTLLVADHESVPAGEVQRGTLGRPRRDGGEPRPISREQARRLVEQAREEGLEITGQSGLLQQMMKSALEAALADDLTDHLGYEPGDRAGRGPGNSRNGTTSKTVLTEPGPSSSRRRGTARAASSH